MKLDLMIENFLLDCNARNLSRKTISRYRDELGRLQKFVKVKKFRNVTADTLRLFFSELHTGISQRTGKPLSPFSIHGIYRTCRTFFVWTTAEGLVRKNPMQRVRAPKTPRRLVPRLSAVELKKLIATIETTKHAERNLALVFLMIDSGLRRNEVLSLTLQQVKLDEHYVVVIGKGNKEREIPIGEVTCDAIREWITSRPRTTSKQLFVCDDGHPLSPEGSRAILRRAKKILKVERLYHHLLRHTFAKMYLRNGDLKSLSQILGHTKTTFTADTYVDFDIEDLKVKHRRHSPLARIRRAYRKHRD